MYQIKRLAHPRLHSPIRGLISEYIVGLKELARNCALRTKRLGNSGQQGAWLDLSKYPLAGVEVVDRYTYQITLKGRYPQFQYWLAMNFFAPVPIEADRFYAQPGMAEKDLTLDWYPVGTGPYMLTQNNPNARMVLERNPNYRGEPYPADGEPQDRAAGLLADAGKTVPFIDKAVFSRERERIPYWNKFLQGYYDVSGISSDSFDQAVRFVVEGEATVSPEMAEQGIKLETSVTTSSSYVAFNWLDPVVGGAHERARKLRQAISIAVDMEEYISIFANGRGIPGQGPIPPGIFGYREGEAGINPRVYDWVDGAPRRKPIEQARRLLAQAGYAGGRDANTGEPLILYLDAMETGPDDKPRLDWYRKQFAQARHPARDSRQRLQSISGEGAQGLNADLLLGLECRLSRSRKLPVPVPLRPVEGRSCRAKTRPTTAIQNSTCLFDKMKIMENSPGREALIDRMVAILREDAPWLFGYHPKGYSLLHAWIANVKPNQMARNEREVQKDRRGACARRGAGNGTRR